MLFFIKRTFSSKRPELLGVYSVLPRDLFRINASAKVILRDGDLQLAKKRSSYDVILGPDGLVHPSPSSGRFERPNGMSLRPNGPFLQEIIRSFKGKNVTIYKLPKGLELETRQLTCLWEHSDHHSVQTTVPIELDAFNEKLTLLCLQEGDKMTKDQFLEKYPFEDCMNS